MATETLKVRITGTRPLLMHNVRLADPLSEHSRALKKLTLNKSKTDELREEIMQVEWLGGLYQDDKSRIAIPEDVVLGCVIDGAKKVKLGVKAKSAVLCDEAFHPLKYKGPVDVLDLYKIKKFVDYRAVDVGGSTVMRTRPRFNEWSLDVKLMVETSIMEVSQVLEALETCGRMSGMGDFRPRFGRFEVQKI